MSLVYCPECGHEISANAIACPNCGLPLSARPPVVEEIKKPVAPAAVVTRARGEGLPPWAIPVFAVSGILLLVILFLLFRGSNEDTNTNVNLAMNAREFMRTDVVLFSIALYALLGKGADLAVRALERLALRWDPRSEIRQVAARSPLARSSRTFDGHTAKR